MPARQYRVTRGDDYRRIVRTGNRVGGATCIAHAVLHVQAPDAPAEPARFGFIVSKAVGNAVTRNLVRRRMKFLVEQGLHEGFSGADIVFRALPASADAGFDGIAHDVNRALRKVERMVAERAAESVVVPVPAQEHGAGA